MRPITRPPPHPWPLDPHCPIHLPCLRPVYLPWAAPPIRPIDQNREGCRDPDLDPDRHQAEDIDEIRGIIAVTEIGIEVLIGARAIDEPHRVDDDRDVVHRHDMTVVIRRADRVDPLRRDERRAIPIGIGTIDMTVEVIVGDRLK